MALTTEAAFPPNAAADTHRSTDQARARAFVAPLLSGRRLDTGEDVFAHADACAALLAEMGADTATQVASYLVYVCDYLSDPKEAIAQAFGAPLATLAVQTQQLIALQRQAKLSSTPDDASNPLHQQLENVRKMLLAFSQDVRVVVLRLASRLQTLRYFAANKARVDTELAVESLHVFAPLANRLGLSHIKWELEDLSFRFLEPKVYKDIAKQLQSKRSERETQVKALVQQLTEQFVALGIAADIQGRPKHIYSIVKKMRGKNLAFNQVMDITALRVIVPAAADCYSALAQLHQIYAPIDGEFDDYIAKPKANGYQSLHTVVAGADGTPVEVQIRSHAMHEHAEHGVAAHWAYKEAGAKGYAGVSANSAYEQKIVVLRQLLAWERDLSSSSAEGLFDDRIYVLTPEAAVVELAKGATPVDFAYAVHTNLGHRCRGAKIDGVMVPLSTPLQNGQTVEITAAKTGAPSRDWLNTDLGYLATHRARAKVRAWFNAEQQQQTIAKGRELVLKVLQREGKTTTKLDQLAQQLHFSNANQLFEVVGKDEFSLRHVELALRPQATEVADEDSAALRKVTKAPRTAKGGHQGVLVVGVGSLMTQLAGCCKPVPPDTINGYITRGKGVSVHRSDCNMLQRLIQTDAGRAVDVEWGGSHRDASGVGTTSHTARYAVDVAIFARDRQGLLRDISEVFSKEKCSVTRVRSLSDPQQNVTMRFTIEVSNGEALTKLLKLVAKVESVMSARRV